MPQGPGDAHDADSEALRATTKRRFEAGHSAWPQLDLEFETFAQYFLRHATVSVLPKEEYAADMYLACACAHGVEGSLAIFEETLARDIARAAGSIDSSAAFVDDALQATRERLFVRKDGEPSKISDYAGRSSLRSWLCAIAVRWAISQRRRVGERRSESFAAENDKRLAKGGPEFEYLRARYKDAFEKQHGAKLGFMSFFVKAAIEALKLVPQVNAEVRGHDIVYRNYYDVGIAVGGGKGLVVPLIRNAERLSFAEIERAIAEFARRAQENKLKIEELQGGTFTISSLGGIGGTYFTPIINAPEVAIMGACRSFEKPVWDGKQFLPRLYQPLSLSWDHRVIDGAAAARFNAHFGSLLTDMRRALV